MTWPASKVADLVMYAAQGLTKSETARAMGTYPQLITSIAKYRGIKFRIDSWQSPESHARSAAAQRGKKFSASHIANIVAAKKQRRREAALRSEAYQHWMRSMIILAISNPKDRQHVSLTQDPALRQDAYKPLDDGQHVDQSFVSQGLSTGRIVPPLRS